MNSISSTDTIPEILLIDTPYTLATLQCCIKKIIYFGATPKVGNKHNILDIGKSMVK
jgi:hypothetical protein